MSFNLKIVFFLLVSLLITGCQKTMEPVQYNALSLPSSPNYALVAPSNFKPSPTIVAKQYDVSKEVLSKIIVKLIKSEPRIKVISENWSDLEFTFIQRTPLFRFPDQIDIKFVDLNNSDSSFIMLSRSQYGYSDLGKNKKRMNQWVARWDNAISSEKNDIKAES